MFRLAIAVLCSLAITVRGEELPQIAVASSLQFVMPELVEAFEREQGFTPRTTYGASGNFTRQIMQGAPFQLLLSADESYVDRLNEEGLTRDRGKVYALGQLAVIKPKNSRLSLNAELSFIDKAIDAGEFGRFAIANPKHAPYGRAARETLVSLGLWEMIQPYLLRGENASQALQFALSGSSSGGLVPYALTFAPAVKANSEFVTIDPATHRPIRHKMVLMHSAGERAGLFYEFITGKTARGILASYGYKIPPATKHGDN